MCFPRFYQNHDFAYPLITPIKHIVIVLIFTGLCIKVYTLSRNLFFEASHIYVLWKTLRCSELDRVKIGIQPPFLPIREEESREALYKSSGMPLDPV
jgi:hypothetical protein